MASCSLLWLSVVYYGYLLSAKATCSLLWLPVVYLPYHTGGWPMPTSTAMSPKCSIDIAIHAYLPVVYYCYLYIYLHSLLWVPVVYYGYLWSTKAMPICSLQCCLVFCTQLLYYAYLVFIITASMLLSLHCLLSLPILLSGLLTHSCIPCLVYMTIQSAMSK